jgi:hypothetical protein
MVQEVIPQSPVTPTSQIRSLSLSTVICGIKVKQPTQEQQETSIDDD